MRAQTTSVVIIAALAAVIAGSTIGLAALWGGTISLIAYAWGGFQVWLHPGNRAAKRMAGAAVPVTGVAGSGNLGMTTLSAVLVMAKLYAVDDTTTRRRSSRRTTRRIRASTPR